MELKEKLIFNTIAFEFPKEPVTFYFCRELIPEVPLVKLGIDMLWPANIGSIFPGLAKTDTIYTSFDVFHEGMTPLAVILRNESNYYFAKRYYNRLIRQYFCKNYHKAVLSIVNITKDNEVWVKSDESAEYENCARFDRFLLKIDYDHFKMRPQLLLAYEGSSHVLLDSVAKLRNDIINNDPFDRNNFDITDSLGKVIYVERLKNNSVRDFIVKKYNFLSSQDVHFRTEDAFPVLNLSLMSLLGYKHPTKEHHDNPLIKYRDKITSFYKTYLDNVAFRQIVSISTDGFTLVDAYQSSITSKSSSSLLFGGNTQNINPTFGLNNGPYLPVPVDCVELICVFHSKEKNYARFLMSSLHSGYGAYKNYSRPSINPMTGKENISSNDVLKRFTGKDTYFARFFIEFQDNRNPFPEINKSLINAFTTGKLDRNKAYMALYISPINKYDIDSNARSAYSRIKDAFLNQNIMTQVILTENIGQENRQKLNSKGEYDIIAIPGFAYTLQNIALAICAKMGGTPWRIATQKKNELVIGIGAFFNKEKGSTYIGSAFSFDNTGSFNSFECFMKDQMRALVGSMKDAIIRFSSINGRPDKIIIHYYKHMSRQKEYKPIEDMLESLDLDKIPVYVVTVNKTESEDFVVFNQSHSTLLPYSGTYVNLGNGKYLLCNNTRYCNFNGNIEGFPFPIKLRIWRPKAKNNQIDSNVVQSLIEQVYQFSRIYFKSVKQQHLPVTLKYPELVSEMLSSFDNLSTDQIDSKKLWFL